MKKLLQKKTVKIGIAVIILAVAAGIISINARSAQRQREYDSHVDAAEKYLTELDYEQAIAEYTLALEIEPNNEDVLNALEQTYLDYAQSLADAGEYEKAISVLEEGYAQTGRESLREKLEELAAIQEKMIEFPFELTDITIMGYDLFDDHFEEICAAYGCPVDTDGVVYNEHGYRSSSGVSETNKSLSVFSEDAAKGWFSYGIKGDGAVVINISLADLEFYNIHVPVPANNSLEDWNRIMQVEKIKEKGEQQNQGGGTEWLFQTKWGQGYYYGNETEQIIRIEMEEVNFYLTRSVNVNRGTVSDRYFTEKISEVEQIR